MCEDYLGFSKDKRDGFGASRRELGCQSFDFGSTAMAPCH
jgi:hypothetical protein